MTITRSFGLSINLKTGQTTVWANNSSPKLRPSGTMCKVCTHVNADCGALPLETMPIIKRDSDGTAVVKCLNFERGLSK